MVAFRKEIKPKKGAKKSKMVFLAVRNDEIFALDDEGELWRMDIPDTIGRSYVYDWEKIETKRFTSGWEHPHGREAEK